MRLTNFKVGQKGILIIGDKTIKMDVLEISHECFSVNDIAKFNITGCNTELLPNSKPLKPLKIYTNEKKKVVVVKWEDGTTTKATCSQDDHFDVTVGFAMCYVKKVYGGKKKLLKQVNKLSK